MGLNYNQLINYMPLINYIPYSAQYLDQIHNLVLNSIAQLNAKDYSPETIHIMQDWQSIDRLSEKISKGDYYLAIDKDTVVGVGGLVGSEISTMFTDPAYIKQGIAKNILKLLEKTATQHGIKTLYLSSSLTAQCFYLKCGYTIIRQAIHQLNGHDFAAVEMTKSL